MIISLITTKLTNLSNNTILTQYFYIFCEKLFAHSLLSSYGISSYDRPSSTNNKMDDYYPQIDNCKIILLPKNIFYFLAPITLIWPSLSFSVTISRYNPDFLHKPTM